MQSPSVSSMKSKILKLVKKRESEILEFKPSLSQIKGIIETISAFSNTRGGSIIIGVDDKRNILGVDVGKKTIESLANKIKQNTDPQIYPFISVENIDSKNIIVVEVKESKSKPVFAFDRVYKRVGGSNHRVSSDEIRKMALEGKKIYWDEEICEGVTLEDINWKFVEDFFIPLYEKLSERRVIGKPKELLKSLGCIKNNEPTNAGILLFGKNLQKFFLSSYIALARYKGKEVFGEKLDYKEFTGNLFQQIDSCNDYLVEHTALMSKLVPGEVRRRDITEYGRFSVRELITNAVCHRDYEDQGGKIIIKAFDDKIEFYNIGGLPEWITPENITSEQYSRNPTIAKVLAKVEYIEELGEGWDKIIKEHKEHPLNPKMPEIKSTKNSTFVTLFSTKEKFEKGKKELNERQKASIDFVRRNNRITAMEYRELNDVTKKTATRDLHDLVEREIFIKIGRTGKGVYYTLNPIYKGDIRGRKGT